MKKAITLILTLTMLLGLCAFSGTVYAADEITVTDMIGREVTVTPGRGRPAYVQLYRRCEPAVRRGGH